MNRIKLVLNDDSISYFYAEDGETASAIAKGNEIAVAVIDFNLPVISGEELSEYFLSVNPNIQICLIFNQADTKNVIRVYNKHHINKLMCKEYLVLEDLPSLIDSCLHTYNREDEIAELDEEVKRLNELYLRPMQEMSSILNERLAGYEIIKSVFRRSFDFVLNTSEEKLKSIDIFVDRILNEYISIYMVSEPEVDSYIKNLNFIFHRPDEKKYFKLIFDGDALEEAAKCNFLFILEVLTICFDVFYMHYRGKISVSRNNEEIVINSIYEVRRNQVLESAYPVVMSAVNNILKSYSKSMKAGIKDNIIQYKVVIS